MLDGIGTAKSELLVLGSGDAELIFGPKSHDVARERVASLLQQRQPALESTGNDSGINLIFLNICLLIYCYY